MKSILQKRWFWFFAGLLVLPLSGWLLGLCAGPNAKAVMPFTSICQEERTEFFLPADFAYTLKSKATKDEFTDFVKKMRMHKYRVSDTRYEKTAGQHTESISYEDGWIIYREEQK
jgi:hypothetical protein